MTPTAVLEHVNVTVRDPQATAAMLDRIFGWKVRWSGGSQLGGSTIHVGTADQYLAIYQLDPDAPTSPNPAGHSAGLNHVGVVVDDLDATEARVVAEGFEPHSHQDYEPGRRFYFQDHNDVEYEVVSYT